MMLGAVIPVHPVSELHAEKKGYSMKMQSQRGKSGDEEEMARGSFMVASQCRDCNKGYNISQIQFSGYDKPATSDYETFFITNGTDRTMTGVTLYVDYLTVDGRQLNRTFLKLSCVIPPGETRQLRNKFWDPNHSFHYRGSNDSRKPTPAFKVVFDPVAYWLRF